MDLAVFNRVHNASLVGSFLATKHFAPLMVRSGGGRIIYLSSAASVQSGPGGSAYASAKAGVNMLAAVVHQELADEGIRTTAIAPGLTVTPGMREIVGEEHLARTSAQYPGGRVGQPEDLVPLSVFLCSEAAGHLSGSTIFVRPPITSR
jgi:NAD(P)-dependent dehydrogenase (short-subunit alcohol dehydrogenase family)